MKKLKKFNENWIDDETNDTKARNAALDNLDATPSGKDAEPFSDEDYDKIFDKGDIQAQIDAALSLGNFEAVTSALQKIKQANPELAGISNPIWSAAVKKWHSMIPRDEDAAPSGVGRTSAYKRRFEEEPIEDLAKRYKKEADLVGSEKNSIDGLQEQIDAAFKNKNTESITKALQEIKAAHPELNDKNSIWWDALKKWHKILMEK